MEEVVIHTPFIKLDSALKLAGLYPTGGQAKEAVLAGVVSVNDSVCLQRGRKCFPGDVLSCPAGTARVASCG